MISLLVDLLISYKKMDFSSKDPKSDLKTACWKVQSDILINRETAGCSQTLPDQLIWFFISRLRSSNCSSVAYMWSSQRKGFTWASPLLLSSLTVSPSFPGHSFLFFPSLFFQSCAQWPSSFCLRCPSASPRSIFLFSPFHSLGVSALFLNLSPGLTFSLSPPPSLPLSRDKQGSHLKTQAQHFLFLLYRSSSI